ncbi:hypothetical protein [Desulfovibrio sp.]|uniref:hypothetical protein n=1 Tax=Desulfovibrio sp. TaxID=885 RepID=UPI0023D3FC63|nr:hypothetical protein [Desulfovibrio sp.]MDE7242088.1 hypothetical protein [Desulfovibrio sp.]
MTMSPHTFRNAAPRAVAALVPVAYLFLYTPYGMDTTDFGYFYGYAWRVLEGQMPYRDFSYIKPALPIYWHAFWLGLTPENLGVLAGKAGFLATLLGASWCAAAYLGRIFSLTKLDLPLPLLATCGFVWGVHSFPHMPWHTADGVLFAGGALLAGASGWPLLAGVLGACAMLCKQSFLLVPPAIVALVWVRRGSWHAPLRCLLGWLAALVAAWLFLKAGGALEAFSRMTTGQLDLREALDAGIFIYVRQNWLLPLLAAIPWLAARVTDKRPPAWLFPAYVYLALLTAWYVREVIAKQGWIGYGASWPTLFVLLGCLCALFPAAFLVRWLREPAAPHPRLRACVGLGAALVAAWSVAISGGYKIPALFATPLLFSLFVIHARLGGRVRPLAWAALAAGLVMFGTGYQFPYVFPERPMPRAALTHDAGSVYPRASGVMVDADMLGRLAELKALRAKYGPDYKTLPAFSFAYYLNGDKPVYSSDWLIDWEINGEVDRLYKELLDKNLTVFMERDQMDDERADAYDRAGYGVPQRVRRNWRVVEETPHFVVFQPPLVTKPGTAEGDDAKK